MSRPLKKFRIRVEKLVEPTKKLDTIFCFEKKSIAKNLSLRSANSLIKRGIPLIVWAWIIRTLLFLLTSLHRNSEPECFLGTRLIRGPLLCYEFFVQDLLLKVNKFLGTMNFCFRIKQCLRAKLFSFLFFIYQEVFQNNFYFNVWRLPNVFS